MGILGLALIPKQLLSRNVERFQGGLAFKAHDFLCHSTQGSSVMKKGHLADDLGGDLGLGFEREPLHRCACRPPAPAAKVDGLVPVSYRQRWKVHDLVRAIAKVDSVVMVVEGHGRL